MVILSEVRSSIEENHFTSMTVCNLTEGPVIVSGDTLRSNGMNETNISELEIIGSSLLHFVRVSNANMILRFENAFINSTSAVTISNSNVSLVLDGSSFFSSSNERSAGLDCSSDSNITLQAVLGGSLFAFGVAVGIGTPANGLCGSVTFLNGSIEGRGDVGLGVGFGEYGGVSRMERLTIQGGDIQASGTYFGSGIGNGRTLFGGIAMIGNLTIVGGNVTISNSSDGSGIGTGYSHNGTSMIGNLTIMNGDITARSSSSVSPIGTGYRDGSDGTSKIGNLTIMSGNITVSLLSSSC
jgi:hypothetical protein